MVYRQWRVVGQYLFEFNRLPKESVNLIKAGLWLYPIDQLLPHFAEAFSGNQRPDISKAKFFDGIIRKSHPQSIFFRGFSVGRVRSSTSGAGTAGRTVGTTGLDRKSTRLNSSH